MAAGFRGRLTYSNVTATVALFVALSGSAYAAHATVFGSGGVLNQCIGKHGTERAIATGARCKRSEQFVAINEVGPTGPAGSPGLKGDAGTGGPAGAQGGQGTPGVQGTPGTARAYGLVTSTGTLSRQSNVVAVSHPNPGEYCITLVSGIDPNTTGVNVTVNGNDAGQNPFAQWAPLASQCAAGQLEVITALYNGTSYFGANVGFFFSIP
jgi:hypothetical protein